MLQNGIFTGDPGLASAPASGVGALPTAAKFVEPNGTVVQGGGNISTGAFTYNPPALNWTLAGPVFPANTAAGVVCGSGGATGSPCPLYVVAPNLTTPMVGMWTLSVQHAFSPGLSLEVAYVGNHGDNLTGVVDINSIDPTSAAEIACGHCEASTHRPLWSRVSLAFFHQRGQESVPVELQRFTDDLNGAEFPHVVVCRGLYLLSLSRRYELQRVQLYRARIRGTLRRSTETGTSTFDIASR